MTKIMKKILPAALMGALVTPALADKIEAHVYTNPDQGKVYQITDRFAPGSYVYIATSYGNGGYFYIDGDSVYAAGSVNRQHSTVVTEAQVLRTHTQQQIGMISDRLAELNGGGSSGAANMADVKSGGNSGSHDGPVGVWAKAAWTHIDDSTTNGKWDGDMWTGMIGADRKINKNFVAGLSLVYTFLDMDTKFNKGDGKDHAYGVVPYVSLFVNKHLSFDVLAGWTHVNKDRTRNESTITGGTQKVRGKVDSDRWFAGIYANIMHSINRWNLLGRLGYNHAADRQDSFRENNGDRYTKQNVHLDLLTALLQAGYKMNETFEPFINGRFTYDASRTKIKSAPTKSVSTPSGVITYTNPEDGRKKYGFGGGAGLKITGKNGWTGTVGYDFLANKKLHQHSVTAKIRYQF